MADLYFLDSETRSESDVTVAGAYKYARHSTTEGIVWGFAADNAPCGVWSPPWAWHGRNIDPTPMLEHAAAGGLLVAWNAFFDRWIWNAVMVPKYGWPETRREQWLCAQAQAEANNLPGGLAKACDALRTKYKKDPKGTMLIKTLCNGTRENWDRAYETPELMGHFRRYCASDVVAMRDVWQATRPLTMVEWAEYHTSERINDRGVAVDVEFARHARNYAQTEFDDINAQLAELTGDPGMTLSHHKRKSAWLHEALHGHEELQMLTEKRSKEGEPPRYSADRPTREAVLEMLLQPEHAAMFPVKHTDRIVQFLELLEAGNSAAVRKFTAIVKQEASGRVHGGYSFNGAGQTGRFSSRGIQIHNIIRAPVEKGNPDRALDAMEDVMSGATPDELRDAYGYPVSRLLARLIRPTFVAPEGRMLIWADYDQIEGRALPWLAHSPEAEAKLDIYRSGQDVYSRTAAEIADIHIDDVTDIQRQAIGKVPELALGFGGSVGALSAMSRSYGVSIPERDKPRIVDRWRAQNPWATAFWHDLWEAAIGAFNRPHNWHCAGRVRYYFHPDLMYGTLICELPCGRWIVYPQFEHYLYDYEDPVSGETWKRWHTSCVKGIGGNFARVNIWYGVLAENITQGIAASLLRAALRKVDDCVVLHTHDEIVIECDEMDVSGRSRTLSDAMTELPEWAEGLPLTATVECGPYYTK